MRIAISGTHSVGKSTLVADFLSMHGNYIHEEEPYRALRDFYDIKFGKDSTRYCNGIQLYYNITRVLTYSDNSAVIFDRSPVDYIAYSLYTARHGETDINSIFVDSFVEPVRESLRNLDLIVFVPMSDEHPIELEDDGIRLVDKDYQVEVDDIFKKIYREQLYNIMPIDKAPQLIEVVGPREKRIEAIKKYL